MARKVHTPKKAKTLAEKAGSPLTKTPLNKMSKPKMKAGPPRNVADQTLKITDMLKDAAAQKAELDARTLFIRFSEKQPKTVDEIKELHSDIQIVRTPRTVGNYNCGISFAFLEFGTAEECIAAKKELANTKPKEKKVYVDFVGENSNAKKKAKCKEQAQLNPTRLFIGNLGHGVDKKKLQEKFPKADSACIPHKSKKKGTTYGFVQFSSPAEAKAAFDASQNITIDKQKITVLFAKMTELKQEPQKIKGKKRKAETDEIELKREKEYAKTEMLKTEVKTTEASALSRDEKRKARKEEKKLTRNKIQKKSNEVDRSTDMDNVKGKTEEDSDVAALSDENAIVCNDKGVENKKVDGEDDGKTKKYDEQEEVARKESEGAKDESKDIGDIYFEQSCIKDEGMGLDEEPVAVGVDTVINKIEEHENGKFGEPSDNDEQDVKRDNNNEKDVEGGDIEDVGGNDNEDVEGGSDEEVGEEEVKDSDNANDEKDVRVDDNDVRVDDNDVEDVKREDNEAEDVEGDDDKEEREDDNVYQGEEEEDK